MPDALLILGASTRAAAASALRAGLTPSAVDLFADDDLRQMVQHVSRVDDFPGALPKVARDFPAGSWIFTGALENHPGILAAIAADRTLWGIPAGTISRLRDPWQLARSLRRHGLLYPDVARSAEAAKTASASRQLWLHKPYRSAGGGNIRIWPAEDTDTQMRSTVGATGHDGADRDRATHYLQRLVRGELQSAVFIAARGAATLLGVTRQLSGARWTGATGFRYAGSIGPLRADAAQRDAWCRIGSCLADEFELCGLFGVDAVVNDRGIWTIEVNPRYTSSVEVLEFGLEVHAMMDHAKACRDGRLNDDHPAWKGRFRGKAVLYASREVWIGREFVDAARQANQGIGWPEVADIPTAEQAIKAGHPVMTVYASSVRLEEVEPRLQDAVHTWRSAWNL